MPAIFLVRRKKKRRKKGTIHKFDLSKIYPALLALVQEKKSQADDVDVGCASRLKSLLDRGRREVKEGKATVLLLLMLVAETR